MRTLEYKRVVKQKWPIGLTPGQETILKALYFQTLMRHLRLELVIFPIHTPDREQSLTESTLKADFAFPLTCSSSDVF